MENGITNVLFLCTGNSARSILGEALVEQMGGGRFRAHSAGSAPKGEVHPLAIELLEARGIPTERFRSKCWDEFETGDAQRMDIVLTVCDNAAAESCPVWPGHPVTAHWGIPDPAAAVGNREARMSAFEVAWQRLEVRIRCLLELPLDTLEVDALRMALDRIGRRDEKAENNA